jgi:hypothetical protein
MKHIIATGVFLALSACMVADKNPEAEAETVQSGITFSGTASMGIARNGN